MGKNTKNFQDKKAGVTVAVFEGCTNDAFHYINKHGVDPWYMDNMPDRISAKVKLREGDIWDAEVGKREALHKADLKHRKYMRQIFKKEIKARMIGARNIDSELFDAVLSEMGYVKNG